jgi:hypothetical protein
MAIEKWAGLLKMIIKPDRSTVSERETLFQAGVNMDALQDERKVPRKDGRSKRGVAQHSLAPLSPRTIYFRQRLVPFVDIHSDVLCERIVLPASKLIQQKRVSFV